MGDTFCASLHLKSEIHAEKYTVREIDKSLSKFCKMKKCKILILSKIFKLSSKIVINLFLHSQKFIEKEPKFEDKWMELRKRALEGGEPNGKSSNDKKEDKKSKKKKNKRDSKKDKKKRSRGKKRKRGSSSSSSNSDDSDSSSDSSETSKKHESDHADTKNSIRVQMRNLQSKPSENDERTGKWTMVSANANKPVPPPAPSISQSTIQEKKKDEAILTQWNKLEPIISQEEKRLLENLKGRLKNQQKPETQQPVEKEKRREEKRERSRDRSRSRNRSRSRDVERSRDRNYRRRSRSRSRSRSRGRYSRRSRSRSDSRGRRRRVERPIVTFPTEPRLPPLREEKKLPARSYVISKKEDTSSNSKKVMPMIGKMPVFKKQLSDKKSEEQVESEKVYEEEPIAEVEAEVKKPRDDTWDDFMPDPLQYSALMGAPPPPPRMEEPEPCVPPGLDPEEDDIPKPINDAPIARKGPLPKDFQDTLDLLYDGDKPKPVVIEQKMVEVMPVEPPPMMVADPDGPQMMTAEELSQHALLYGGFYAQNADGTDPTEQKTHDEDPSKHVQDIEEDDANGSVEIIDEAKKEQQMEMDDLAMLGIDVNDVGSGMW
jgi:hypothetical protein